MTITSFTSHKSCVATIVILLTLMYRPQPCHAAGKFLHDNGASVSRSAFQDEIMNAMGSVLGCGGQPDPEQVRSIKAALTPMWRTLPKTSGRIDRRTLRYLVHRFFMQTSSLMVRGFEPTRPTNESHWGAADILSQMVPAYVESILESHHGTQKGFTQQDAVEMVLILDQLIFDSAGSLLEGVYTDQRKPLQRSLSYQGIKQVMETYMIKWLVNAEPHEIAMLLANKTFMEQLVPHYHNLMKFVDGRIKAFDFIRQRHQISTKSARGKSVTKDMFEMRFSFEDAHQIAGDITRSFQTFWQSECESMKTTLVDMDFHSTGRIPLSRFYNVAINTDWRFGESESYLRELGALDETSSWLGPQVIIPNYIQASSNCIITRPHYHVCCVNECESLMGDIEIAIDAPTALPSTILDVVRGMSKQTSLDEDEPPHLTSSLVSQLEQVAKSHGGMVPLHGRLFAQWLHYVFPRECPFPHKIGAVTSATPAQYGDEHAVATKDDMERHASSTIALNISSVGEQELQWMSQWSPEEELIVDYSAELGNPWQRRFLFLLGWLCMAGGAWGGVVNFSAKGSKSVQSNEGLHAHWV
jgi:hypothetical protein